MVIYAAGTFHSINDATSKLRPMDQRVTGSSAVERSDEEKRRMAAMWWLQLTRRLPNRLRFSKHNWKRALND